jgi:hypothetical protein
MQKSLFHLSQHLLFLIIFIALDSIRGVVIAMHMYLYPMKFCQLRHTSLIGVIKHNVTISQLSFQSSTKVFTRHMLFT